MKTKLITKKDTNDQYHSDSSISASGLKKIFKKSVYHHINDHYNETSAMALGTAVHTIMIEGEDKFNQDYYLMPKIDGRTKEGKQAREKHEKIAGDRVCIKPEEMNIISGIMKNFRHHQLAKEYCTGTAELSHYGKMDSIPIRVRPDVIGKDWISDVKTCQDNSPVAFKRDLYKYAYHLQACFYSDVLGFPVENFRFIAVETKYPFSVEVYALGEKDIEIGRNAYRKALSDWKLYLATGLVKGYSAAGYKDDGALIL
jgi:exodeoxyribonuclease VIII